MADQTFTSGQVLTAAQMTTLQANSGLVVVTPTSVTGGTISGSTITIGASVSSVAIANAFSSSFDAYKIIITGGIASTTLEGFTVILTGSTASYYNSAVYAAYGSASAAAVGANNGAAWNYLGVGNANTLALNMDLMNPFLAKPTTIQSAITRADIAGSNTGYHNVSTSFSGFTVAPMGANTITGGTIRVYGYRNA